MAKTDDNKRTAKAEFVAKNGNDPRKDATTAKRSTETMRIPQSGSHGTGAVSDLPSASDRRAVGKALRETVPRVSQAGWKTPKNRRDPIDLLIESNQGRIAELIPIRFGRMMQSPFAFYRGSASIMAADLANTPRSGLIVQACGDAHLMNFGGFATPERHIAFDINDLDETLPAPWEWDIKRLTASVVIAGRYLRLGETASTQAAEATVRAYRRHMADYGSMRVLDVWHDAVRFDDVAKAIDDRARMKQLVKTAADKSSPAFVFPKLVEHRGTEPRFKDAPPLIFHPPPEMFPGMATMYEQPLAGYRASLPDHVRVLLDRYRRHRQRRHDVPHWPVYRGGGRPAVPTGQGSAGFRSRTVCRQERLREPRPAGCERSTLDAVGQRHLPGMGDGIERKGFLSAPASRHQTFARYRGIR